MVIKKLGKTFETTIDQVIENVSNYEVYGKGSFKKVIDEKCLEYNGNLIILTLENGTVIKTSDKHIHTILLDDGNEIIIEAQDIQVGMKMIDSFSLPVRIDSIKVEHYEGLIMGFEIQQQETTLKPNYHKELIKITENHGTIKFLLDDLKDRYFLDF
jgi:hypothetical protein